MFGRAIAILMAAVLLFICPAVKLYDSSLGLLSGRLDRDASLFIESLRGEGGIGKDEYESFCRRLNDYLPGCRVSMELGRTADDVCTNVSDMALQAQTFALERGSLCAETDHVHSDRCYKGHNHEACGCTIHTKHTDECYDIQVCGGEISGVYEMLNRRCSKCDCVLSYAYYERDDSLYEGYEAFKRWIGVYYCGHNEGYYQTSRYICRKCRAQYEFGGGPYRYMKYCNKEARTLVCELPIGEYSCGISVTDDKPICDRVIVSDLVGKSQTIFYGDGRLLDNSIEVEYLDGHKGAVAAEVSGLDDRRLGKQKVTLTLRGYFGHAKEETTATTTIDVFVIPKTKECTYGHIYDMAEDGGDPGCPVCRETIEDIIVSPRFLRFEYGAEFPELSVICRYLDGHTEVCAEGSYSVAYDLTHFGLQEVTVSVRDTNGAVKTETIRVFTEKKYSCEKCGREYCGKEEDGSDGGCPYCHDEMTAVRVEVLKEPREPGDVPMIAVFAVIGDREEQIFDDYEWDYDASVGGTQLVTVTYGNFSYSFTVEVPHKREETCPICGREQDSLDGQQENDGENGRCSYCSSKVEKIEVIGPKGCIAGEAAEDLFKVRVTYADGSEETVNSGYYLAGFDPSKPGLQEVTLSYEGLSETFFLNVSGDIPAGESCSEGHTFYPLYEGEKCPYCQENDSDLDCSHLMVLSMSEIEELLECEGFLRFKEGDALTLKVIYSRTELIGERNRSFGMVYREDGWKYE